ncbi:MAG: lipid-A-disaccharide synthase [Ignavibacteriae bacterium]|nr:MAG: lipid-A-disaccharide synthase [Ignavibacteriota bacterium]
MKKKLLIIAGEASGDLHGSSLIRELKKIDNNIELYGIGGNKMSAEGMQNLYHIKDMSFLGFAEVIKHLPFIRKVKKDLMNFVKAENIKHAVLIDYPGFNLSMAKSFKKNNVKNLYYISPQIWAWGEGRIKKIKNLISKMIVFFPFEEKLYRDNNVNVNFVGHPLVKKFDEYDFLTKEELCKKYNLTKNKKILLLMPGSRKQELEKILGSLLSSAKMIEDEFNMQTVVACADNIEENFISKFTNNFDFKIIKGDTYNLLKNSDFSIVKSGTSTLEAAIIGSPFIVVYKTNYLTYLIGKALIKIKNIALVNIVAEKTIIKELVQDEVNKKNIFNNAKEILSNNDKYNKLKFELSLIKEKLKTKGNPSKKAAEIIYAELNAN